MNAGEKDLSYFMLRLKELLNVSFPELQSDSDFITRRSRLAANAYEGAFMSGNSPEQCSEIADFILFENLSFSKFDTVFKVVCSEFDRIMADEELRPFALKMLAVCEPVFAAYDIGNDFAASSAFELLCTELTGTIAIWIEDHGLQ
ncbi:DUF1896 family protein [Chryseobacterium sp. SL1]|uniref:DUF1896 family protein n=1 Tax=Chryseobacterium sp. SL1 TaxID=2995159 RepID=UPI0022751A42|nr:DUF1896 family protein [Chryseobacterium sp. SL1]MCY1662636.1 DUF1896 family protein [Chryseobacterium sp. SL1]